MKKIAPALLAVGLSLAVTGCGGIEKDATYESVSELREAILSADVECAGQRATGSFEGEDEEQIINCGDDLVLRVFENEDAKDTGTLWMLLSKTAHVEGPNWIVQTPNTEELTQVQERLGGEVIIP